MKLKGKVLIYLLVSIGLLILSGPGLPASVCAGSRQDRHVEKDETRPEGREARILHIYQQLNLSPEQDRQIQVHQNKHKEQGEELNQRIRAKKEKLKQNLQNEELHMEKINRLHSELKALLGQREDHRLEGILEVRKILTTEQLARFMALIGRPHHGPEVKENHREQ